MRGPDITNQFIAVGSADEETPGADSPLMPRAPFLADETERFADLPAYHPLQNIACENPDTLRGTFAVGAELNFHSTGVTDQ